MTKDYNSPGLKARALEKANNYRSRWDWGLFGYVLLWCLMLGLWYSFLL